MIPAGASNSQSGEEFGRQSLLVWWDAKQVPLETAMRVLRDSGFEAKPESIFRDLADQKAMSPAEVQDLLVKSGK